MVKQSINAIEATTAKTTNCVEAPGLAFAGAVRGRRFFTGVRVFFRFDCVLPE